MAVDAQTWLPDESLIRSDRLTMAHGLEQRVLFLDAELAALATTASRRGSSSTAATSASRCCVTRLPTC